MVLRFLTTSSELLSRHQADIAVILDDIDRNKILPPIAVVQILSTNGTASIGLVREYLKKQLTAEKQEIDSVRRRARSQLSSRSHASLNDCRTKASSPRTAPSRSRSARRFKSCPIPMSLASSRSPAAPPAAVNSTFPPCTSCAVIPIINGASCLSFRCSALADSLFFASRSCLGENESQCPNCARTHGVVREIRKNNEQFAGRHELFLSEVAESEDGGWDAVAAAFGKGLLNDP